MSRKKSSFQITSITTEYEQQEAPPAMELPEDATVPRNGPSVPPGSTAASRFRVVKLDQGLGEPYKRGRWTCLDFYDRDPEHQVPLRSSRPSSPALPLFREGSPVRKASDPFGARLSLARSMFAMGGHQDSDDDSGSGSSMIAIDNKIEQAMDLVKTHLMFAVREEVEVLREQIKDLAERNAALEWENRLLRSLASPEQLALLHAQLRGPTA
nr:TSC22 domain family protein 4 isoform X3 [Pelodiscus sinensis]|eukprot:XP_025036227.1 TSC22 domain family protein 4 isoform X3 [Pelodiscus sinensis]